MNTERRKQRRNGLKSHIRASRLEELRARADDEQAERAREMFPANHRKPVPLVSDEALEEQAGDRSGLARKTSCEQTTDDFGESHGVGFHSMEEIPRRR